MNLVDVRLFGSEARGDATPESDIDVLVVVRPDEARIPLEDRIIDLAFDVNVELDVYISPRVVTSGHPQPSNLGRDAVSGERQARDSVAFEPHQCTRSPSIGAGRDCSRGREPAPRAKPVFRRAESRILKFHELDIRVLSRSRKRSRSQKTTR